MTKPGDEAASLQMLGKEEAKGTTLSQTQGEFTAPEVPTSKVEELQTIDISQGARKTRSKPKANRRREKIKRWEQK